ncbi:MAG: PQQ-binding-like beta-propeller repeat protein, partial [Verrucomicrobiota bacterium]
LLWRAPSKTSYGRNCTTPVIVDNWVIAGSYQNGLVGVKISPEGGGLKAEQFWTNKAAAMNFSSPVAVGQHLYGLGPSKNLICVEAATGKIMWSKEGYFTTAPNVAYAAFLVLGKNVLVCTDGGQLILMAADPSACREISRAQVCGLNWCSPAYADGRLFVRDGIKATGNLYCLDLLH